MDSQKPNAFKNISSSAQIKAGLGRVVGVFCASSSSGTLKLWDSLDASTTVLVNTFPVAGAKYYDLTGIEFLTGLYATIANTADITIFYQ